jgi:hypothetical protein
MEISNWSEIEENEMLSLTQNFLDLTNSSQADEN